MKIITEPSVYLLGQSSVNDAELDRFLMDHDVSSWTTNTEVGGEKLVEVAGRTCYMSFAKPRPGGNKAYIDHILEVGHGSVCEHAVFNLLITGVSRSLTHELVRHRAGMGYSQLSQRFVDESDCAFVMPPLIRDLIDWDSVPSSDGGSVDEEDDDGEHCELWGEWQKAIATAQAAYETLSDMIATRLLLRHLPADHWHDGSGPESFVELNDAIASLPIAKRTEFRKAAREAARSVLPNATETKIFVTGNARALRHFLELRGTVAADAEIRRLALTVYQALYEASPNLFGDYTIETNADGVKYIMTPYQKV